MKCISETIVVTIPRGRTLRLREAQGLSMRVLTGCLWLTEERDTQDYMLEACDQRIVATPGLTLAYAFGEARVEMEAPEGRVAPLFEIGGGYNEYAAGVWMNGIGKCLRDALRAVRLRLAKASRLAV